MTVLVHITKIENERSIRNAGIKPGYRDVVFFMPHMKDFVISHQWARELKRSGIKNFAAVDFRISNDEEVWFGKYNSQHQKMKLGEAVAALMNTEDVLGYELFIDRKIEPNEILNIRPIPKPMGWRYQPGAHGKRPCPCPVCIQSGGFKTKKIREPSEPSISKTLAKKIISISTDEDELWKAVRRLQGRWKRESPAFLERLFEFQDEYLLFDLVELVSEYRHPLTKEYLAKLAESTDADVKELALEYLQKLSFKKRIKNE